KTGTAFSYPWYMGQIRVDPTNPDRVYFMGVPLQVSTDGGHTFRNTAGGAHSDHHAMWIDPTDPDHLIIGCDGGVYISHDRGRTVDFVPNLPISQYYAIATDMRQPFYYVYGGLQDNSSWCGASYLFKSTNRGDAWVRLGPDLTRQLNRDSLPVMGKIWPRDAIARHQGTADYGNISTVDESPIRQGLLYVGTDDGVISVSRDGGATWTKYTKFPDVPDQTYISR